MVEATSGNACGLPSGPLRQPNTVTQIVFVQHDGQPGELQAAHTPSWEIHALVAPQDNEPVFQKRFSTGFRDTALHAHF